MHPAIRGPLIRTSRNSTLVTGAIFLVVAYALITTRFVPSIAPVRVWWPFEIVGWIVVLLVAVSTNETLGWWMNPRKHPALVRLARDGDQEGRLGEVVAALDGPCERHGSAMFTAGHMIVEGFSQYAIVPTEWIVWAWAIETQHRKFGVIPMGRSYQISVALRGGETITFSSSEQDHQNVLVCIAQRPGNHLMGADETIEKAWASNHEAITQAIDEVGAEGRLEAGPGPVLARYEKALRARVDKVLEDGRALIERAKRLTK
jgi:hypothetical protein